MNKEKKVEIIKVLSQELKENENFYLADISGLDSSETYDLRKEFYGKGVSVKVVKNTLLELALKENEYSEEDFSEALKGATSILFSENASAPAKVMKELRKGGEKPVLKAAYVYGALYVGDENLEYLSTIKSKEELIGDIILLLQSPMKNVVSSLGSAGQTLSGLLKTLSERKEA